ncbi:MAG: hypothetical protein BroJett003_25000 [Planctomycetota bacterium]|nr:MAG: hypothetical protein BroJett003_25000 [Planctomycetota bacterium]
MGATRATVNPRWMRVLTEGPRLVDREETGGMGVPGRRPSVMADMAVRAVTGGTERAATVEPAGMVGTAAIVVPRPTVPPAVVRTAGRVDPAPAAKVERAATEGLVSVQAPMGVTVVEAETAAMDREAAPVAAVTVETEIHRETAEMEDPAVLGQPVVPAWGV